MNRYGSQPLYIIKLALGGTPLSSVSGAAVDSNWSNDAAQLWDLSKNYVVDPAIRQMHALGKVPECVGIVWLQGEDDASVLAQSAAYYDNFRDLVVNRFRGQLGFPAARVITASLSAYPWTYKATVDAALTRVCLEQTNCVMLRADGTGTSGAWVRDVVGVGGGQYHYNAIGISQASAEIFENLQVRPAAPFVRRWDYELTIADYELFESLEATRCAGSTVGPVVCGSWTTASSGYIKSFAWIRDDNYIDRAGGIGGYPEPHINIWEMNASTDVECIFQMAHWNSGSTIPGILVRSTFETKTGPTPTRWKNGYLFQVRLGGAKVTLIKGVDWEGTGTVHLAGSPYTPTHVPTVGDPYWYRLTVVGSTFTIYNSSDGRVWELIATVTDSTFPSGDCSFSLYGGGATNTSAPLPAHSFCHFPYLAIRRL